MARKLRVQTVCDYVHLNPVRAGLLAPELAQRRKGDLQKLALARRLRCETTMTLKWIAERLNMGAAGSLANLLRNTKVK